MVRKISSKKQTPRKNTKQRTLYPLPGQARAGALAAQFYGYEFVLFIDASTRRAQVLGGVNPPPHDFYQTNELHRSAIEETLKRGIYHYEWSWDRSGVHELFQSTCVSLAQPGGLPGGILTFTRNITYEGFPYLESNTLKDFSSPRTFAQILLATRETEKKEISKALHDEIGSSAVMLTALLSLVRASVQAGNPTQALRDLKQLDMQLKESIERIKSVVVSLRPPSLETRGGLGGAVRDLLENISTLSHVPYVFDYDSLDEQIHLSDNVKILLYRIVQEALTNIVKHAHAKQIRVCLKQIGQEIHLAVCDDGVGFEPTQQLSIEHVGLLAMKDSVELLGGTISIKSAPGKGTRIEVCCPCIVYGGKTE